MRWDLRSSRMPVMVWRIRKAKSRPITEATCMVRFRFSWSRSIRAAMIPWMVSGIWISEARLCEDVLMVLLLDGAVLQEAVGELLHEEGVARGALQDEVPELRGHISPGEDGLHQLCARLEGELIHADLGVVGAAPPGMGELGTVEEDEKDMGIGQPADEVVEKLLGGPVDPVEVLDGDDEGLLLADPDEEVPEGLEGLLPSSPGVRA